MPLPNPPTTPKFVVDPRPWAFTVAELTAGLRAHTGDPTLAIANIEEQDVPEKRPSMGRIRGLNVTCRANSGGRLFNLVLKEPQGTTRAGTAGVGRRELMFYRNLSNQLPVRVPQLLAAHHDGEWLVFNRLSETRQPEQWNGNDYLLATEQLAVIHDRFWSLGEDLGAYAWLSRPLGADFQIYLRAANTGVRRLSDKVTANLLTRDQALIKMLQKLVENAEPVAKALNAAPATLLHGDYWPGNLALYNDNTLTVYDWQQVAIGPGVLDLFHFIQASQWYFGQLPIAPEVLVAHYRMCLQDSIQHIWDNSNWDSLWDYALLWTFLVNWVDLLANIPGSILQARFPQMVELWLKPVGEAMTRRLPKG